jgi:gliding motility-associated-like protein
MKLTAATLHTQTSGDNGTDTLTICGDHTSISAAPAGEGATGKWTTTSTKVKFVKGDDTSENTTIEGLTPGIHNLLWTITKANGCVASAPLVVVNDKYEALASLASANPICNGEATIIGNVPVAGAEGFWEGPSSVTFLDKTKPVTTAYLTVQGNNMVEWHIKKGPKQCETVAYVDIYNLTVESVVGDAVIACNNTDVRTINAQPAPEDGTAEWTVVSGEVDIADKTSYVTSVTGIQQGTNTLKWTVKSRIWTDTLTGEPHQCEASDYLEVNNNYFTTSAGPDREVCADYADLRATYHGSKSKGHWSGGYFDDPESYKTRATNLQPSTANTFTWTVESNGCEASDEVVITSTKVKIEIPSGDKFTCTNSTNIEARQSAGVGKWSVPMGNGDIDDVMAQSTMIRNLNPDTNIVRWTVTFGQQNCVTTKEVKIVNKTLNVTAGFNQSICDTFYTLAGMPLGENQVGTWYSGVMTDQLDVVGDGPKFDDPHLYNTRVTGLYYDEDGGGYSNPFTWFVKDTVTGCTGDAIVQITSYHFNVDPDSSTVDNMKTVTTANSVTLHAKESKHYSGRWDRVTGNGTPQPQEGWQTTVTGLSSGYNQISFTATLNPRKDRFVPQCKAVGIVTVAYIAFKVDAGTDRSTCADSIQLNAEKVPNAVSYWTAARGGGDQIGFEDQSDPKTWVHGLTPGRNVLLWNVIKNGFLAQDSVVIYNYSFNVTAGEDQHLCEPQTVIEASGPLGNPLLTEGTFNWTGKWDHIAGGVTYANREKDTTEITEIKNMTNKLVWRVTVNVDSLKTSDRQGGLVCYQSDTVDITYYTAPKPDFGTDPANGADCTPFTVTFQNNTVNNDTVNQVWYHWNFGNGYARDQYTIDTIQRTFVNKLPYDSIIPVWLVSNVKIPNNLTCTDTLQRNITVYAKPDAKFSALPEVQVQPNMNVNFYKDSIPGTNLYRWDYGDSKGEVWKDNSEFLGTHVHTYDKYGEYTIQLYVKNKYCADSSSRFIKILPAAPTSIQEATKFEGCVKYRMEFSADGILYSDSIKWDIRKIEDNEKIPEAYIVAHRDSADGYTFVKPGLYYVYISAYGPGASSWISMRTDTVAVYATPTADFATYPDTVRLPNIPLYTQDLSSDDVDEWLWEFGDGEVSHEKEPTHYYTTPGYYNVKLTVKSHNGTQFCPAYKSDVYVWVEPEGMLKFPNAFRPDPAGPSGGVVYNRLDNFVFIPYPRNGVKEGTYILEIFNRYGEKIYESTDVNIGWDGYYRGKLCPQDVYVYKCKCTFENGKIFKEIGNVTLLR